MDPLEFWRLNKDKYPILAYLACRYLAILATSAPSESIFSQGSDLITKKRNRLGKDSINYILSLKN